MAISAMTCSTHLQQQLTYLYSPNHILTTLNAFTLHFLKLAQVFQIPLGQIKSLVIYQKTQILHAEEYASICHSML